MSSPAIRVSGLGKRYRIGERVRYKSLRESLANAVTRTLRGERRPHETIWALKDVSFEVQPGEVVGVIGRNGAGKSTLLKILSRITEPTEGRVELHGRVGSLLEVGTGFHLEMTGRENIYLNGAILGMKRAEIQEKFDKIVEFSEVGDFLDTPVKHYSSGMYLRLAFAIGVHLEPEVLLVDEVLAVGDAAFQRKCLQKVAQMGVAGHTILLVSHDLNAVRGTCSRTIWLNDGSIMATGPTEEMTRRYRDHVLTLNAGPIRGEARRRRELPTAAPRQNANGATITDVVLQDRNGAPCSVFETGEAMRVTIIFDCERPLVQPFIALGIERLDGLTCYGCTTIADHVELPLFRGRGQIEVEFEELGLLPNSYRINVGLGDVEKNVQLDAFLDAAFFQVRSERSDPGTFYLRHQWRVEPMQNPRPDEGSP